MLKIMYVANIIVAGWIGFSSLFFPKTAQSAVFGYGFAYSEAIRLVGALWLAIFVLSFLGLFYPESMCLVLLFQLIYKSCWLIFAALPAIVGKQPYPKAMALFFLVWVLVLPLAIPWNILFPQNN